ncbi:chitooligosaccharidolytic beta-N-acetylglucosaminidase-like [Chironomus tepperi]|uniref:chitooligosaccharidolytic beta-N-acetylglucosaminidase-like n=1 Tax=Chironomus tepperi TaxID=113505 RepID=UPI00391FA904
MFTSKFLFFIAGLVLQVYFASAIDDSHAWGYECINRRCEKTQITATNKDTILSLRVCRLYCYDDIGTLWPKPTGNVTFLRAVTGVNPNYIKFTTDNFKNNEFFEMAKERFINIQKNKIQNISLGGLDMNIDIKAESEDMELNYDVYEGYDLTIISNANEINVKITSKNFFGARHALETLSQVIVYDELNTKLVVLAAATIHDEPKFKHRGISMDTSRNFYPVRVIKKTIEGLSMAKLNSFHWHITDSQAFPMEVKSHPDFTKYGAYSKDKVYTADDIKDIVKFAKSRGVRVIPELDAPAHIGEGWQKKLDLTTCVNYMPYLDYCWQPPCGHMNPIKDELYDVLEDIYREMLESFTPPVFHMGGDEIFFSCWNTSKPLQDWMLNRGLKLDHDGFLELWGYYQTNALARMNKVGGSKLPIMLWTSELTEEPFASKFLEKDRYVIQIWTTGDDSKIQRVLNSGYKVIISNNDAFYLDCGFGSWASDGLIWCSPYNEWQKVYNNDIDGMGGARIDQILGGSATIWSESIDEQNLDSKIWPRASALAERLWTNPKEHWRNAEPRFLMHQMYLKSSGGLASEVLQPEWCVHNEGLCQL